MEQSKEFDLYIWYQQPVLLTLIVSVGWLCIEGETEIVRNESSCHNSYLYSTLLVIWQSTLAPLSTTNIIFVTVPLSFQRVLLHRQISLPPIASAACPGNTSTCMFNGILPLRSGLSTSIDWVYDSMDEEKVEQKEEWKWECGFNHRNSMSFSLRYLWTLQLMGREWIEELQYHLQRFSWEIES